MVLVMAISNTAQSSDDHSQPKASPTDESVQMELTIFARFHAHEGKEQAVASELRDAVTRVRTEPGCLGIEVYRSVRNSRLFWLRSRWPNEAAFEKHVERPETHQSSA
jgi:quinol monooxygenase YgiN